MLYLYLTKENLSMKSTDGYKKFGLINKTITDVPVTRSSQKSRKLFMELFISLKSEFRPT